MKLYLEPDKPGLDRRIFRYGHVRQESYIEFAYFRDWVENGKRARWYGFANREMPANTEMLVWMGD